MVDPATERLAPGLRFQSQPVQRVRLPELSNCLPRAQSAGLSQARFAARQKNPPERMMQVRGSAAAQMLRAGPAMEKLIPARRFQWRPAQLVPLPERLYCPSLREWSAAARYPSSRTCSAALSKQQAAQARLDPEAWTARETCLSRMLERCFPSRPVLQERLAMDSPFRMPQEYRAARVALRARRSPSVLARSPVPLVPMSLRVVRTMLALDSPARPAQVQSPAQPSQSAAQKKEARAWRTNPQMPGLSARPVWRARMAAMLHSAPAPW
jgi:hypothetical protein